MREVRKVRPLGQDVHGEVAMLLTIVEGVAGIFVSGIVLCGIAHYLIVHMDAFLSVAELRRDAEREARYPRLQPVPTVDRAQTRHEGRLQAVCDKYAARIGVPPPIVYISSDMSPGVVGAFSGQHYRIRLNSRAWGFWLGWRRSTIKHELVHAWQFVNNKPMGHGPDFRDKAMQLGTS